MAVFTWIPSLGASLAMRPNVRRVAFGDGYEQRLGFGIHSQAEVWTLEFRGRTRQDAGAIDDFLRARGGVQAFDWATPAGTAAKFTCEEWSRSVDDRQGEIVEVFHSHPNLPPEPSQADRVACEATGLPWSIVSFPAGQWAQIKPVGYVAPLVGRQWAHGVLDCYALVRDWYVQERGIELPDFERFDEWWKRGLNLYLDNFGSAGFEVTDLTDRTDLKVGDVLLMQVASPVPNHAAVYLGDGLILHHLQGRLSSRDVYGGYWQKVNTHALRHPDLHPHL